jgi:hypothetical protein
VGSGAVRREALDAGIGQAAGKLDDAFTVTDGEKGAQSTSPMWLGPVDGPMVRRGLRL